MSHCYCITEWSIDCFVSLLLLLSRLTVFFLLLLSLVFQVALFLHLLLLLSSRLHGWIQLHFNYWCTCVQFSVGRVKRGAKKKPEQFNYWTMAATRTATWKTFFLSLLLFNCMYWCEFVVASALFLTFTVLLFDFSVHRLVYDFYYTRLLQGIQCLYNFDWKLKKRCEWDGCSLFFREHGANRCPIAFESSLFSVFFLCCVQFRVEITSNVLEQLEAH